MFCVLKRTVSSSFEYQQHVLWLRNKKIVFFVHMLNLRPGYFLYLVMLSIFYLLLFSNFYPDR